MKKSEIVMLGIIIASAIIGLYFYPQMPAKMASHWNIHGEVDGYLSRFWALFFMPIISAFLFLVFIFIPRIDPLKNNIAQFRKYYDEFAVLVLVFILYVYLLTIVWNRGIGFNIIQFLAPAFGLLYYYCGALMTHTKRNWFIGIRTPWTLHSEKVWEKTHKIGAILFKISGLVTFLGIFLPGSAIFLIFLPVIVVAIYAVIYSYIAYQKEEK